MTTVYDSYTAAQLGGPVIDGFVRFRLPYEIRKSTNTVTTNPIDVDLDSNGAFTVNLQPGPYEVSIRIPGTRDYLKAKRITVPDSGSVRLADLLNTPATWSPTPPVGGGSSNVSVVNNNDGTVTLTV